MKSRVRAPRKKKRWDLPNTAYQAIKETGRPLMLKDLKTAMDKVAKKQLEFSLSSLHTELNLDGRFVFTNDRQWAIKSQVPHLRRRTTDELDILEEDYQPIKADYKWINNDEDSVDDESELLVPYDENEEEIKGEIDNPEEDDEEDEKEDYPENV